MTEEVQEVIDRLAAKGKVELDPKSYAAVMAILNPDSHDARPDYSEPVERAGTRAERSAVNREAHRILNERRAQEARKAREARRAETRAANARTRPSTQSDPSTAGQRQGKG
jgi:hypothetical protein